MRPREPAPAPLLRRLGASRAFVLVTAAAYAIAMLLPALAVPGARTYSGLEMLLDGWQGARAGVLAWYANPLFGAALALALGGLRRAAGVVSGLGCVLALTSFAAAAIARRNGVPVPEMTYLAGFYVWLAAQLALLGWCWIPARARGFDSDAEEIPAPGQNGIDPPRGPP